MSDMPQQAEVSADDWSAALEEQSTSAGNAGNSGETSAAQIFEQFSSGGAGPNWFLPPALSL